MLNSKIKKIIYLIDNHFCERDYNRYGIELLQANGFEVLVWEITPIINPDIYNKIIVPDPIKYKEHEIIYDKLTIQNRILKLADDCLFIIILARYCSDFYKILKTISYKRIPYCFEISGGCYPIPADYIHNKSNRNTNRITNIFNKIKKINYKFIKEQFYKRIPCRLLFIRPADFIIVGGGKSHFHLYRLPIGPKTEILPIHYFDYDNYLTEMREPRIHDQTIGVFLDQCAPFHPDQFVNVVDPLIKAEDYYPYIRNFLDYLEGTFKVKIIIAAHPRSQYENSDYFGGRPIIRNKTCEMVRRAGFVIAHNSTAINYAVLFNKPIIFLTSEELGNKIYGIYINLISNILGKKPIFMDKPYKIDWETELLVDTARYHEYKQNHIKMDGTKEIPFWQVVADYIKSNY